MFIEQRYFPEAAVCGILKSVTKLCSVCLLVSFYLAVEVVVVVVVAAAVVVHHDTLRGTATGAMIGATTGATTKATTETMIVMMTENTDLTGEFFYW